MFSISSGKVLGHNGLRIIDRNSGYRSFSFVGKIDSVAGDFDEGGFDS